MSAKHDILTIAARMLTDSGFFGYATQAELDDIRKSARGDIKKLEAETERVYHIRAKSDRWMALQKNGEAALRFALSEYKSRYPHFLPNNLLTSADDEAAAIILRVMSED